MQFDRDTIGTIGESLALAYLLSLHGYAPLFRGALLGEKWPTTDLMLERYGRTGVIGLIQVKATTRPWTVGQRLPIHITRAHLVELAASPVPTYLVGVHIPSGEAFIQAVVDGETQSTATLPTAFSLRDPQTRETLAREIDGFWGSIAPAAGSRLDGEPR